jgi:restriction system protein
MHSITTIERLRAIDWFQFEAVAARILRAEGWAIETRGGANPDGGADILATRNGRKAVVQCKHWQIVTVKPPVIRELLGTKASAQFQAHEAILFSLSDCTEAALDFAHDNQVLIRDSREIASAIDRIGIGSFPELTDPDRKSCPKCGSPMVLRVNAPKPFWGCSTYPRCRGVIERSRWAGGG